MISVRDDLVHAVTLWAIRLGQTKTAFCNACIAYAVACMERGLPLGVSCSVKFHEVQRWLLRQGFSAEQAGLESRGTGARRIELQQRNEFKAIQDELAKFEEELFSTQLPRLCFQVQEGLCQGLYSERWPEKIRRFATELATNANDVVNRMIKGGIEALEQQDWTYESEIVREYYERNTVPQLKALEEEKSAAKDFNPYEQIDSKLDVDSSELSALREIAKEHSRQIVAGLMSKVPVEEGMQFALKRRDLGPAYFWALQEIYLRPEYEGWRGWHPLWEKKIEKAVVNALVTVWRNRQEQHVKFDGLLSDTVKILPQLSEEALSSLMDQVARELSARKNPGSARLAGSQKGTKRKSPRK